MPPPAKACDQCNRRRIKCGGDAALCDPCIKASLDCTYDKPVKRKGAPGKILTTLKQRVHTANPEAGTSRLPTSSHPHPHPYHLPHPPHHDPPGPSAAPWAPGPTPSIFDSNLFDCGSLLRLTGDEGNGVSFGGLDWMETLGGLSDVTGGWVGAGTPPGVESALPTSYKAGPLPFPAPPKHRLDFSTTYRRQPTAAFPTQSFPPPPAPPPAGTSPRQPHDAPIPRLAMMSVITPSTLQPQIDEFFSRMQPVLPVFSRAYVDGRISRGDHLSNIDFASMIIALSSYALLQLAEGDEDRIAEKTEQAKALMGEAVALQTSIRMGQAPTLDSILTSFFLFGSLFALNEHNSAWFRLREAVTLAETLEIHRPTSYAFLGVEECGMRVRLFWILSVTERAFAVQRNHSITFRGVHARGMARMTSSSLVGGKEDDSVRGLQRLSRLFEFIDEDVVSCWNGNCVPQSCRTLTIERVVELHHGLSEHLPGGSPESARTPEGQSSDVQHADLLITQQWLRNRVWQLSVSHGIASDDSPHASLSPTCVFEIAQLTLQIYRSFSRSALEGNGIGLAEKIHDIALSIILVINVSHGLGPLDPLTIGRTLLPELIAVLRDFRGGKHPFLEPVEEAWDRVSS